MMIGLILPQHFSQFPQIVSAGAHFVGRVQVVEARVEETGRQRLPRSPEIQLSLTRTPMIITSHAPAEAPPRHRGTRSGPGEPGGYLLHATTPRSMVLLMMIVRIDAAH